MIRDFSIERIFFPSEAHGGGWFDFSGSKHYAIRGCPKSEMIADTALGPSLGSLGDAGLGERISA
jgi:hypothetical protein